MAMGLQRHPYTCIRRGTPWHLQAGVLCESVPRLLVLFLAYDLGLDYGVQKDGHTKAKKGLHPMG